MAQVFDSLKINGYRGFQLLDLPDLGQVNIFVGNNNSGKTSLLEAISILCNPLDPFQWLEVSQRRLYLGRASMMVRPDLEAVGWVFPKKNNYPKEDHYQEENLSDRLDQIPKEISMEANGHTPIHGFTAKLKEIYGSGSEKSAQGNLFEDIPSIDEEFSSATNSVRTGFELQVTAQLYPMQQSLFHTRSSEHETFEFWDNERFVQHKRSQPIVKSATIFPSYSSSEPILNRLSQMILQEIDAKSEILDLIKSFDANVIDIQILSTPTARATLYIEHRELGFAPLYVFGDGFKRALIIALTLLTARNGILLIDEIETSIHVSALHPIFSWLTEACRHHQIQLFVTTHSLEAIDAMLQPETTDDDIVAFRLSSKERNPQRFSGNLLHRLRAERGLDVR
jgi:AAA15 family ATPase/GTPase